jgi:hypothetical protein
MLRVTLRGHGVPTAVLGSGETLLFGRSPATALPAVEAAEQLRYPALSLPRCTPHVSRLLGELTTPSARSPASPSGPRTTRSAGPRTAGCRTSASPPADLDAVVAPQPVQNIKIHGPESGSFH